MDQGGKSVSMQLDCCWTRTLLILGIPKDAKGASWWEMAEGPSDLGWGEEAGRACR